MIASQLSQNRYLTLSGRRLTPDVYAKRGTTGGRSAGGCKGSGFRAIKFANFELSLSVSFYYEEESCRKNYMLTSFRLLQYQGNVASNFFYFLLKNAKNISHFFSSPFLSL